MPWGDNGITNKRRQLDQSATVTWGGSTTRVPTRALSQVGYLSTLKIKVPVQAATLTVPTGVSVCAAQPAAQRAAFRGIQAFDITAQGISPFYQLSKGTDLAFLEYVRNGKDRYQEGGLGLAPDAPSSSVGSLGRVAASLAATAYQVAAAAASTTSQNVQYGAEFNVPLTEHVRFPAFTQQGPQGPIAYPERSIEIGLVTLQSTQQNITPHVTLNPLYSTTVDSPFVEAGGTATGTMNTLVELYTEFFDVPTAPSNQPPAEAQMWVCTRTSVDDAVSAGAVTHTHAPAGLLMRAISCFYDANDNLVDVSALGIQAIGTYPLPAQVNEPQIAFMWGSTVYKTNERASVNLAKALETYGEPPPPGALFLDFFTDHTLTDMINTAILPGVRTQITGLPASVTTLHTIEERMIPVRAG